MKTYKILKNSIPVAADYPGDPYGGYDNIDEITEEQLNAQASLGWVVVSVGWDEDRMISALLTMEKK